MSERVAGIPAPVGDPYAGERKGFATQVQLLRLKNELVRPDLRAWARMHTGPFGFYFTGHTYDIVVFDGVEYAENVDNSTRFVQVECFNCFETLDCV